MFEDMKYELTILKVYQYVHSMLMVCERLYGLCSIQINNEEVRQNCLFTSISAKLKMIK